MLTTSRIMTFLAVTDREQAREFYGRDLGLLVVEEDPYALVFDANGILLRVSPVQSVTCAPYTVLGWEVEDIRETIDRLGTRGIRSERFAGFPQDEMGICRFPNGTQVVWFKDPDGNLISLTQFEQRPGKKAGETTQQPTDVRDSAGAVATSQPQTDSAPRFKGAFPISGDLHSLPVKDLGPAIGYYTRVLGFRLEARTGADRAVLRRDDAVIGLAKSGADPEQVSCYFSIENLAGLHAELTAVGIEPSEMRPSEHDGRAMTIFFAKEPYGVCFCFGEQRK